MKTINLNKEMVSFVDDEDYDKLVQHSWYVTTDGYAARSTKYKGIHTTLLMHRVILGCPPEFLVDHKDRNRLNNVKTNLRLTDYLGNAWNTGKRLNYSSKYKGVCWDKSNMKWRAAICVKGNHINLGRFTSEVDAAKAYDDAAVKSYGPFACINFPDREVSEKETQKLQCYLCGKKLGIVELRGGLIHQQFQVCYTCLKYVLNNMQHGLVVINKENTPHTLSEEKKDDS